MSDDELKPCPFCGGEPKIVVRPDSIDGTEFYSAVSCCCDGYSARAHQPARCKTQDEATAEAISAWNHRAPQPEPAAPTPELPEPALHANGPFGLTVIPYYSANQMRQAAWAAAASERERCAKLCESTYPEWNPENATFQKPCLDTPAECAAAIRGDQP